MTFSGHDDSIINIVMDIIIIIIIIINTSLRHTYIQYRHAKLNDDKQNISLTDRHSREAAISAIWGLGNHR